MITEVDELDEHPTETPDLRSTPECKQWSYPDSGVVAEITTFETRSLKRRTDEMP
jgi:hypothetical protein